MSEKCPHCRSLAYDKLKIINVICFCYYTCICVKVRTVILNIALTFEPVIRKPGPEVIFFSCSTQVSMKFIMLINVKMSTIVGI